MDSKHAVRKDMKKVLAQLDDRWVAAASSEVSDNLSQLLQAEVGDSKTAVLAWTKFFPGEVDLSRFIIEQLGKRDVYLPRSLPDLTMQYISIGTDWVEQIEDGFSGVPEPRDSSGNNFHSNEYESVVVIVPGIAFDRMGNRLGRGKGYYDRFLESIKIAKTIKIGVCWSLQIISDVPISGHDVPMDIICTEEGYATCKRSKGK